MPDPALAELLTSTIGSIVDSIHDAVGIAGQSIVTRESTTSEALDQLYERAVIAVTVGIRTLEAGLARTIETPLVADPHLVGSATEACACGATIKVVAHADDAALSVFKSINGWRRFHVCPLRTADSQPSSSYAMRAVTDPSEEH